MTDEEYVRFCLGGRPEMFRQLVMRYETTLIKHLIGRLGNRDQAAEAAQETLVRAYFALPKLKKSGSFFPWLLGIADRVAQEMRRSWRRYPTPLDVDIVAARTESDLPAEENHPEPDLGQAVATLPEPYRQVILMRFYGGQSCPEISQNLGISLGTVTSRLSRAYAMLRDMLRADEQGTRTSPMIRRPRHDLFSV